ncbi:mechanosensitive ion channel family protein [Shimia thalassica]|uniref:mechanosensitive ion channel family protein n=1 Tax=Shimia thalassica TaxID=1715693 RepID=UPI0026E40164|nr:mechanosensitive ion channel domain-containing protein [Shimia thalassica]MDO6480762.1 mechanosensitive ion channel [Shimia thalassica]
MLYRFLILFLTLVFMSQAAPDALAQESTSENGDTSELSTALKAAAESGVSVVIIDSDGKIAGTTIATAPEATSPETAADSADKMTMIMKGQKRADDFRKVFKDRMEALPAAVNEVLFVLRASSPDGQIFTFAKTLMWTLALLAVGILFEREIFGKRLARGFVVSRIQENPHGYSEKLPFLVFRFFAGCIGVMVSVLVASVLGTMLFGSTEDTAIEFTILTIVAAYSLVRITSLVWRMILSPYLEQYRIPNFSTPDAKRLHRWLFMMATMDICTMFFGLWLSELGLNYDVYAIGVLALTTLFALFNLLLILVNRRAISNAIRDGRPLKSVTLATRLASQLWAPLLSLYVIYGWMRLSVDLVLDREQALPLIAGAYLIFTSIVVVYATINYGIEKYFNRSRTLRELNTAAEEAVLAAEESGVEDEVSKSLMEELRDEIDSRRINTFEDLAQRISGILALVAGLYATLTIFGGEQLVADDGLIGRFLDVVIIIFIGYIVFNCFRIWIDSKIREEQGDINEEAELGDEGGETGASRLATLLPLFRNFILIVILVTITLIILMEFGVNVSPLFAGAGVVGLAIGFGAQTLVRDVFSGAFFLFDDAFRKGEYIDIGGVKGTVEKISVRSFQLRHHLGPLHTVPFGEIQHLTNYSRDWVIMKLPLRVTYDTDVERVRKMIKNLGIELLDDPVIGDNFIQPLKSQGVIEMQDSAMIIRVKFMTKPGDQWLVRKKVFQEIRSLFEREGIRFAHREVTVRLADEDAAAADLTPKQKEAIAGAVQGAIDEDAFLDDDGGDDR